MEPFYCKLKDPKYSEKLFGVVVDSQTIIQPDQKGELVPTPVIGVVWKEIVDGELKVSNQPCPAYVPPIQIQYLGLVSELNEEDVLEEYWGIAVEEEEEVDDEEGVTAPISATAPPAQPQANA